MNIFTDIVDEKLQAPKYKMLKNIYTGEREILQNWVVGFEDRDNKIIKEFQTSFHSAFWEFYLFALFKEAGFEIDFSYNRPDFIITSPSDIYVEAVISNIKQDGKKEDQRNLDDILSMLTPPWMQEKFHNELDESIIRHSNAIHSKSKLYLNSYKQLSHVKNNVPYVIALGAYDQVNYGNQFYHPIMALLFGHYYHPEDKKYSLKMSVRKPNTTTDIEIGLFNTDEYKHVSAVIFSATVTLGKLTALSLSQDKSPIKTNFVIDIGYQNDLPHYLFKNVSQENPEQLSDGVFIFHNPFAEVPLDRSLFNKTNATHIFKDGDQVIVEHTQPSLYSRFNHSKIGMPDYLIDQIILENYMLFNNREILFSSAIFDVLEINIVDREIVLQHPELPVPTTIDLNNDEIKKINKLNIKVGQRIKAIIFSIPNENGITEEFKFLTDFILV